MPACAIRKTTAAFLCAAILVLVWSPASASVLVSQTPEGFSSIVDSVTYGGWAADDLRFSQPTRIDRLSWWGGRNDPYAPVPDSFRLRLWQDYDDTTAGFHRPADVALYDVTVNGNAHQATDAYSHQKYFAYYLDLPTPFEASAGQVYWVGVWADLTQDPNDPWWGWRFGSTENLSQAVRQFAGAYTQLSSFGPSNYDLAFTLDGQVVPEPAAIGLLGLGLVLGLLRRKERSRLRHLAP